MRIVRLVIAVFLLLSPVAALAQTNDAPSVLAVAARGVVTPVMAGHLGEAVTIAERDGHDALLVEMDTPGGLDTAMREIVRSFLNSRVPVIVWVAPSGARAASAGAVIALSAHVAAMAPGTNIGAATPVDIEGGDLGTKVVNDATAYVVAIAETRGRDVRFARDIVRDGRSEPAAAALEIGAIDLVEATRERLLARVDGERVELADGTDVELRTDDAAVVDRSMGFVDRVRQTLADPNLAFLFMSLGTLAIIYEIANPGIGLGGIAGVILLVLAMFALSVLPVNAVGLVLLLLAAGLFIAELFVPGIGVLAAGGTVSLVLSGVFLVRGDVRVQLVFLLPTAIVMFGAVMVAGRLAWRARKAPTKTGPGQVEGLVASVRTADGRRGQVFIEGSWWTIRSSDDLEVGMPIRVTRVDGLELVVEPVGPADEGSEP